MKQRILLKGAPGLDLLHRISSLDILGLSMDHPRPGLLLDPSGKIIGSFRATRRSSDTLELQCGETFLEILERYTFAEQYEIEELPPEAEESKSELDRILALTPKEGFEFSADGRTNPLEVNLREAISDQKGCYPGQEVIEKIISLGSPARRLCLLRAASRDLLLQPPLPVYSAEGQEVGTLTSFADGYGLATLKRTHWKEGTLLRSGENEFTLEKAAP